MLQGQAQGTTVSAFAIDIATDAFLSQYGLSGSLVVAVPLTEYAVALNAESSSTPGLGRQVVATVRQPQANAYRAARWVVGGLDVEATIRLVIVDATGAPAAGAAGDVLIVSVIRTTVPA